MYLSGWREENRSHSNTYFQWMIWTQYIRYFIFKVKYKDTCSTWLKMHSAKISSFDGSRFGFGQTGEINYLTLQAPTPQNGQTHSNNSSANADELFECVRPFRGVGA